MSASNSGATTTQYASQSPVLRKPGATIQAGLYILFQKEPLFVEVSFCVVSSVTFMHGNSAPRPCSALGKLVL